MAFILRLWYILFPTPMSNSIVECKKQQTKGNHFKNITSFDMWLLKGSVWIFIGLCIGNNVTICIMIQRPQYDTYLQQNLVTAVYYTLQTMQSKQLISALFRASITVTLYNNTGNGIGFMWPLDTPPPGTIFRFFASCIFSPEILCKK